jgi:hypothetical protein
MFRPQSAEGLLAVGFVFAGVFMDSTSRSARRHPTFPPFCAWMCAKGIVTSMMSGVMYPT